MSWKDTFRWIKGSTGKDARLWVEEDNHSSVMLSVADEQDSVSLELEARTLGTFAPGIQSTLSIRISYADLVELVHEGQEILVRHADQIRKG